MRYGASYATFDAGISYKTRLFTTDTPFRFDITNLTNRHYWTNIVPGMPVPNWANRA